MNLFFLDPETLSEAAFELLDEEANHAARVLRVREGDELHATDGRGGCFRGIVRSLSPNRVVAEIEEVKQIPLPQPVVTIALGMIKKRDRLEFALEKCTELGVHRFVVFQGDHSEKSGVRIDRLKMIAKSAMKQSLRVWLPEVDHCSSLSEVTERYRAESHLVADETSGAEPGLPAGRQAGSLLVIIGPEGGFSQEERTCLSAHSYQPFSLGRYRLRAETAAIAAMYRFQSLSPAP